MSMSEEAAKALRKPFPPTAVGKLPRVWCGRCRDAIKQRQSHCDQHQKTKCRECGNSITTAHLHLDYVGHAAVTDRLLEVDPSWSWEPLAFGADGLPQLDRHGGLWIRLTVAGVTRLGYGDADGKQGPDGVKGAVSDALRNAAMRFGVALDLWHKDGDLGHDDAGSTSPAPAEDSADAARRRLAEAATRSGWDLAVVANRYKAAHGTDLRAETDPARIDAFRQAMPPAEQPATNGAPQ